MSDIEQQFFKTFGIEPKQIKICRNINHCPNKYKICNDKCKNWRVIREDYPEITDRKLLEMICIVFNTFPSFEIAYIKYTVETLKDKILSLLILAQDDVYFQIQQLFKEEE